MSFFKKGSKKNNDADLQPKEYVEENDSKLGEKVQKEDWDNFKKSQNLLYLDLIQELKKKAKMGMNMGAIGVLIGLGAVTWHITNPVTVTEPYILRVDNTTGAVDVVSTVKEQTITQSAAVDRYWVAEFVRAFEGYTFQTIQYTYDRTLSMADQKVAKQFERQFEGVNARHEVLGEIGTRQVNVKSVLIDDTGVARVRFETITNKSGQEPILEAWVATVGYEYNRGGIKDDKRLLNPLGFTVKSYTIGSEVVQQ